MNTREKVEQEYQRIRTAALDVLRDFDGLTPAAFWAEVEWRLWPRPSEVDIKAAILRMICEGWDNVEFSADRKIRRGEKWTTQKTV